MPRASKLVGRSRTTLRNKRSVPSATRWGTFTATVPSELLTSKDSEQGMVTWWTIGMLLLTNFLTIYIHFSHTLAGVITTSLTVLYLPSNPLQPCSVACTSFWIITRLLTLICQQFSWPYSHWNMLPLLRHSLISSTCINRLLEHDQSLKLGLLWILDLQSLTASDLLSFIKPQNPTCASEHTLRSAKQLSDTFHLICLN